MFPNFKDSSLLSHLATLPPQDAVDNPLALLDQHWNARKIGTLRRLDLAKEFKFLTLILQELFHLYLGSKLYIFAFLFVCCSKVPSLTVDHRYVLLALSQYGTVCYN